jgi:D-alanine-D-alanine ligase
MTKSVNVLMGGPSVEHEVSLKSGLEVMRHLDPEKYRVQAVVVSQEKYFFACDFATSNLTPGDLADPAGSGKFKGPFIPSASLPLWNTCDVAFLALHGTFGEDGVIQGFLDTIGVPYTGSGVSASAIAMEKIASKFLYINHGLSVPPWSVYGKAFPGVTIDALVKKHGFPCFVKCPQSGSSRLMGRAGDRSSLTVLISEFERHADRLLVESAINGIEFSCGILENEAGAPYALPPIEIRPVHGTYFDYTAKYTTGESEEIVPAPRPKVLLEKIMAIALHTHMILGCTGVSRTDMIYADDRLYVLETNTLPGMTPNSLLPKAFVAAGGTYGGLLDALIRSALKRKAPTIA